MEDHAYATFYRVNKAPHGLVNSLKLWSLYSPSQKTSRSTVHARFHCLAIPRRDLGTKKTKPNLEKLLYSLGVMLQF